MKKIIALLLVLVLGLVVFSSCAKEEAPKEEEAKLKVTFVNKLGQTAKKIVMKETAGKKNEWAAGDLADGTEVTMEITTTTLDGAPSIQVTYELENGSFWGGMIQFKGDQVVTLTLDANGSPNGEIKAK